MSTDPRKTDLYSYYNSLGRYQGETPRQVIELLHNEALKGWKCSLEQWKKWNHDVFKARYQIELPLGDDPESETKFLNGLVQVGVLTPEKK